MTTQPPPSSEENIFTSRPIMGIGKKKSTVIFKKSGVRDIPSLVISIFSEGFFVQRTDQSVDLHPDLDVQWNSGDRFKAQLTLVQIRGRIQRSVLKLVQKNGIRLVEVGVGDEGGGVELARGNVHQAVGDILEI